MKSKFFTMVAVFLLAAPSAFAAKNVILFIGDGMGPAQVTATRLFYKGPSGKLTMDTLPYTALVKTYSANEWVTDSAAAGTAMATGQKTNMDFLGEDASGIVKIKDGRRLSSIAELAKKAGKKVGILTSVHITDKTPGAFYSHSDYSKDYEGNARQLLKSQFDVFLGGGRKYFNLTQVERDGVYTVAKDREELKKEVQARKEGKTDKGLLGLFASKEMTREIDRDSKNKEPHLWEMAVAAVDILSAGKNGYFLMVEGGAIDKELHNNELKSALAETYALDQAVSKVLEKVNLHETLVLVTADHETSGLAINGNFHSKEQLLAQLTMASGPKAKAPDSETFRFTEQAWHTGVDVELFATGMGSEKVHGMIENTEIFHMMAAALGLE